MTRGFKKIRENNKEGSDRGEGEGSIPFEVSNMQANEAVMTTLLMLGTLVASFLFFYLFSSDLPPRVRKDKEALKIDLM
jgi:hypothetical protein